MKKTDRRLTEAEENAWSMCEAVAGSGTYMLNGQTKMQVEVIRDLLADLAKQGGNWQRIYGFIYEGWRTRRPWFPDVETMAAMIENGRSSTKRTPT